MQCCSCHGWLKCACSSNDFCHCIHHTFLDILLQVSTWLCMQLATPCHPTACPISAWHCGGPAIQHALREACALLGHPPQPQTMHLSELLSTTAALQCVMPSPAAAHKSRHQKANQRCRSKMHATVAGGASSATGPSWRAADQLRMAAAEPLAGTGVRNRSALFSSVSAG